MCTPVLVRNLTLYGLASVLVAGANAIQVAARANHHLRVVTRFRVHLYDLALFLLLGCCVAVTAFCWHLVARRLGDRTRARATSLAQVFVGGCLGFAVLASDLANFVGKHGLRVPPSVLGAGVGMVVGLGLALGLGRARTTTQRQGVGLAALLMAGYNAAVLQGGYPGIHLLIALASLLLLASAIADWVEERVNPRVAPVFAVCAVTASVAPFVLPPARSVRQNLGASSGSAMAPFVVRWLPQTQARGVRRLPVEQSEWFGPRSPTPAIPPQAVPWFPSNGAVLLLTVEALRSDVVEGRKHDASLPNLARIRDASLRFTTARSPSPSTLTTVTAILTGKYYSQIYFTEHAPGKVNPIADRSARVPELLTQAGIRTVNVRAMWGLGPNFGVGRGFSEAPTTAKDFGTAEQAMDLILAQLGRLTGEPQQRLFLYSHFVDSHAPYSLGGKRATPFDSYLAELELIDRQLGRLLSYLNDQRLASRCLLIVSADHGEAFGEHNTRFHASTVYEELLRVPLMLLHPVLTSAAVAEPVSLIDLSPTLLDLFGVATPGDFMGQSLVPVLVGNPLEVTRPIAVDSGRRKQALFFDDGIKVIRDLMQNTVQVYDLEQDPDELHELTDSSRDVEPYIAAMERFFEVHTLKVPGWKPPWRSF